MAESKRTRITLEALVALGGTREDGVNVRFGAEIAYQAGQAWYIATAHFQYLEDFAEWLDRYGAQFGFRKGVEP